MINLKNLKKGRDYILNHVSDEQFDMAYYRSDNFGDSVRFKSKTDCGTVGCALGWFPFAVESSERDFSLDYLRGKVYLSFPRYVTRTLSLPFDSCQFSWSDCTLDYLFSETWHVHDNTRLGFIERCDVILEMPDLFMEKNNE